MPTIMRHNVRITFAALASTLIPAFAAAQSDASRAATAPPAIGTTIPADVIRDLPLGDNVYAALETMQPEVISDRFNSGGLNVAGDARVGGFLGSWSQTRFRVGDLDVSDPSGSGASLLFPSLLFWDRLTVTTGLMPADLNTPGLAVTMQPLRPGRSWLRTVSGSGSGGSLAAGPPANQPPPVVRLNDWANGSALVSGPLSDRLGLVAAATVSGGTQYMREQLATTRDTLGSGFAHLVFAPRADREWRTLAWVERGRTPFREWQSFQCPSASTTDSAVHVQSTFEQLGAWRWRVFAGVTARDRTSDVAATSAVVERITVGPVPQFVEAAGDIMSRRIAVGARLEPQSAPDGRHRLALGIDGDRASTDSSHGFAGTIHERVNGTDARIWTYSSPGIDSRRSVDTFAAFAENRMALATRASLDAGIRVEMVRGRADGAATTISWVSLLPHVSLRYGLGATRALWLGYARSANTLNQTWLAFGDPTAPTATLAAVGAPGVITSLVGPGTGGRVGFSSIDPNLKRPHTDELVVGFEKRRGTATRYTLMAIARRESNMLGVVNNGAPANSYSTIGIPDEGPNWTGRADDRTLLVYNRLPASFGRDTYLVTNPAQQAATALALRMAWEHSADRLFVLFGATASTAEGSVSNRGFGPLENDQDQPGELFTNPNAASYARGRLFSDRAFTIKWTTMYRFPRDITVGGIARYQDGQPFSRLVVVPGLNQGAEAVQAYPNGVTRFTFTGTFDLRVQKGFQIGTARVAALLDAYNLFTRSNEVEEDVVSSPAFRTSTLIEPRRAMQLGLRLTF